MDLKTGNLSVSVAIASCNGEKYIKEQLVSILTQLPDDGEIVISDDGSGDGTLDVIEEVMGRFPSVNIRVLRGPSAGVKKNFENAIKNCGGDIIFLADQDDIWMDDKIERVRRVFEKTKATVVIHDCSVTDDEGKTIIPSFFEYKRSGAGVFKNIFRNTYIGCCMAFRAELVPCIIPIPNDIEMHDQWIGIISDHYGISYFLEKTLTEYRRHEGNTSSMEHYGIPYMIKKRLIILRRYTGRIFAVRP